MASAATPATGLTRVNYAFAALLIGMVGYFIFWGMGYTNGNHPTLFILATLFEPTRVFRRQFILSHATLADSSNWR